MVYLVFKYLRHKTAGASLNMRAIGSACLDSDSFMSLRCPVNAMYGETSFICFSLLARSLYNFWIYIYFYLRLYLRRRFTVLGVSIRRESSIFSNYENAVRDTNLRGGNSDALWEMVKRLGHVGDKARQLHRAE